jgi:hypothetical protein
MVTLLAIVVVALAVGSRWELFAQWAVNFDSDEALVGLQARDILQGKFALYLPGQTYMGSLQGIVAAPLLALFGNHPNVIRIAPLLWILPGLLALFALDRLGSGSLSRGRGACYLTIQWLCAPAVLFLAGAKARGGNLEGLVLGFWMMVLLWPRIGRHSTKNQLRRWSFGGLLFGLGLWTHEQLLFFLPLIPVCLALERENRGKRSIGFILGFIIGYLPLWLPRVAPMALGPPGMEGVGLAIAPANIFSLDAIRRIPEIVNATLTSRVRPGSVGTVAHVAYVFAMVAAAAVSIWLWIRQPLISTRTETEPTTISGVKLSRMRGYFWRASPAFTISLWLAIATLGSLFLFPHKFADSHWFRFTLGIAPIFVLSASSILYRLPNRLAVPAVLVMAFLATVVSRHAVADWTYPFSHRRVSLIQTLRQDHVTRVDTDWKLAYFIRFSTGDSILCSSFSPPRYPDVNAQVVFAPNALQIISYPSSRSQVATKSPFPDAFQFLPRKMIPPSQVSDVFATLDLSKTLFPYFEPYPLLPRETCKVDWRGWPYRRPLSEFRSIVWQPARLNRQPEIRDLIDLRLRELVDRGEFYVAAKWRKRMILVRQAD